MTNATHRPELRSWVTSANGHPDFPIQNLPLGIFTRRGAADAPRAGMAIGDEIVDLAACVAAGVFDGLAASAAAAGVSATLNPLLAQGPAAWSALRAAVSDLLSSESPAQPALLIAQSDAELRLPLHVGDYTDFYASIYHATNVGSMFRPDNPLLPNYKYVPIGYHGRASSLVASGSAVRRPSGQTRPPESAAPTFGPSRQLDYEAEVGIVVGAGNPLGSPIPISAAAEHIFGLCLVNDWSARDIQSWEYQPLGPFLSKSFATTLSPWIVSLEALAPFRGPAFARAGDDPAPLPYLADDADQAQGGFNLTIEVAIASAAMRAAGHEPLLISRGNLSDMYWTVAQLLTHHASNGCPMQPGDLLASGTISGATPESRGCLLERTWRGTEPLALPDGEERRFLVDGDEVILRGYCEQPGATRIGFGTCRGVIVPAADAAL